MPYSSNNDINSFVDTDCAAIYHSDVACTDSILLNNMCSGISVDDEDEEQGESVKVY